MSSTRNSFRVVRACDQCVCLVSLGGKSIGPCFPVSLYPLSPCPFPCPRISYPVSVGFIDMYLHVADPDWLAGLLTGNKI